MELLQLRYFQKVAEMESMTQAARYFSIPQPSMSQSIARLEKARTMKRLRGNLILQCCFDISWL